MFVFISLALVSAGAVLLTLSLTQVRALATAMAPGLVRNGWRAMFPMVVAFILGYLMYAIEFSHHADGVVDITVPAVFFLGGCFVAVAAWLSRHTVESILHAEDMEAESITDPLTGAFNRRYLDERLREEEARHRRHGHPFSVLMMDIDLFKGVNDTYGHHAGDEALASVVSTLSAGLREMDVIARYGGDEFVVLAPQTSLADATALADRLRASVASSPVTLTGGGAGATVTLGVSIGVASTDSCGCVEGELLRLADRRLYDIKRSLRTMPASRG